MCVFFGATGCAQLKLVLIPLPPQEEECYSGEREVK